MSTMKNRSLYAAEIRRLISQMGGFNTWSQTVDDNCAAMLASITALTAAMATKADTSALTNYVTNSSLATTLTSYVTTATLSAYITATSLATTLTNYVTSSSLATTLASYATTTSLSAYVTVSSLATTLASYVTATSLTATLAGYVTASALASALAGKLSIPTGTVNQYLNGLGALQSRAFATPARSLTTAFQISTTRDAEVIYSLLVTSAATLVLGSRGRLTLTYADNAAMTLNPVTLPTDEFGVGSGLLVTIYGTLKVTGQIPAGKWVMLTTTNVLGTPTYGGLSAQETLL